MARRKRIDKYVKVASSDAKRKFVTGIEKIDGYFKGGFTKDQIIAIAPPPSIGKSNFIENMKLELQWKKHLKTHGKED